jgi:hypothetical protein
MLGGVLLLGWVVWWGVALVNLSLPWADKTWLLAPIFGADFWTQPDWAVRIWDSGVSPYDVEHHMFHYPPIVIQLFRWTVLFETPTALRIWVVALAATIVAATVFAHRRRGALGLSAPPLALTLAFVLYGFPTVFALER